MTISEQICFPLVKYKLIMYNRPILNLDENVCILMVFSCKKQGVMNSVTGNSEKDNTKNFFLKFIDWVKRTFLHPTTKLLIYVILILILFIIIFNYHKSLILI